jgi:hypothetical protein
MEKVPTLARRFIIRSMLLRYKKLLMKTKVVYKISDEKYEELCEKFLNPEFVCYILNQMKMFNEESDSESDDSDCSE